MKISVKVKLKKHMTGRCVSCYILVENCRRCWASLSQDDSRVIFFVLFCPIPILHQPQRLSYCLKFKMRAIFVRRDNYCQKRSNRSFNTIYTQVTSVVREVIKGGPCLRGTGIQGYCFEKHAECGERLARNKQSQGSVCLGFLRGDSSSQSLSNGNQLTANKAAIA